jgi:hypothetical protein
LFVVCKKQFINITRYSKIICEKCYDKDIYDKEGNLVKFYNEGIGGGFISEHIINNKRVVKKEHECYINGIKCYADEARFGGIVIECRNE